MYTLRIINFELMSHSILHDCPIATHRTGSLTRASSPIELTLLHVMASTLQTLLNRSQDLSWKHDNHRYQSTRASRSLSNFPHHHASLIATHAMQILRHGRYDHGVRLVGGDDPPKTSFRYIGRPSAPAIA